MSYWLTSQFRYSVKKEWSYVTSRLNIFLLSIWYYSLKCVAATGNNLLCRNRHAYNCNWKQYLLRGCLPVPRGQYLFLRGHHMHSHLRFFTCNESFAHKNYWHSFFLVHLKMYIYHAKPVYSCFYGARRKIFWRTQTFFKILVVMFHNKRHWRNFVFLFFGGWAILKFVFYKSKKREGERGLL